MKPDIDILNEGIDYTSVSSVSVKRRWCLISRVRVRRDGRRDVIRRRRAV